MPHGWRPAGLAPSGCTPGAQAVGNIGAVVGTMMPAPMTDGPKNSMNAAMPYRSSGAPRSAAATRTSPVRLARRWSARWRGAGRSVEPHQGSPGGSPPRRQEAGQETTRSPLRHTPSKATPGRVPTCRAVDAIRSPGNDAPAAHLSPCRASGPAQLGQASHLCERKAPSHGSRSRPPWGVVLDDQGEAKPGTAGRRQNMLTPSAASSYDSSCGRHPVCTVARRRRAGALRPQLTDEAARSRGSRKSRPPGLDQVRHRPGS